MSLAPCRCLRALSLATLFALAGAACRGDQGSSGHGGAGTSDGGTGTTAPNGNHVALAPTSVSLVSTGGIYDDPERAIVATFQGAGVAVGMPPGQSKPNWVGVGKPQVLSSTQAAFSVYGYPTYLAPGRYSCTLRVATADADGKSNVAYTDLPVALTVPQRVSPASFVLSAVAGSGTMLARSITLAGDGITWAASSDAAWLSVSPASGTGAATLTLNVDMSALAPGEYTGAVSVRDTLTDLTNTLPIRLAVDAHALRVTEAGIGLFSIGSDSSLSRTVNVTDGAGLVTPWSATSDQTWLTVTPFGTTDGTLTVSAVPTDLSRGMHVAHVTVSPSTAGDATAAATLVVGLYVDAGATLPQSPVIVPVTLDSKYWYFGDNGDLVADPIRPFFYLSNVAEVLVYNGLTGVADPGIPVPGARLGAMTVAADGSRLWVEDSATGAIYPIDLATRTVGAALTGANVASALAWSPVDGHEVIFTSALQAIDARSGAIADFTISSTVAGWEGLAASPDGRALYAQNGWSVNHHLARLETHAASASVVAWQASLANEKGDGDGLALSVDGTRLYTWSSPVGRVYDTATMALLAELHVKGSSRSIRCLATSDGVLLITDTLDGNALEQTEVSAYNADLTPGTAKVSFAGRIRRAARSGNDRRLGFLGYVSEDMLVFVDRP